MNFFMYRAPIHQLGCDRPGFRLGHFLTNLLRLAHQSDGVDLTRSSKIATSNRSDVFSPSAIAHVFKEPAFALLLRQAPELKSHQRMKLSIFINLPGDSNQLAYIFQGFEMLT